MKSILFFALLILAALPVFAQDYAPVRAGDTAYFEDEKGNIEAVAVKKISVTETGTVFTLFNQIVPNGKYCYNIHGEHWLGTIHNKPGDEHIIVIDRKDSFFINSKAGIGDSWVFNRKDSANIDTAQVTGIYLKTFAGIKDSVKVILLKQSGEEIWLSKNYGLVKLPAAGFKIKNPLNLRCHSQFPPNNCLINFHSIYDINIGDELHILDYSFKIGPDDNRYRRIEEKRVCIDKFVSTDTIRIKWKRLAAYYSKVNVNSNVVNLDQIKEDTVVQTRIARPFHNSLPYETTSAYNSSIYNIFFATRREFSDLNNRHSLVVAEEDTGLYSWFSQSDSCMHQKASWHNCHLENYYYNGLGGPYHNVPGSYEACIYNLVYYKKGTEAWGTPLQIWPVGEKEPEKSLQVTVSPNPATEKVHIALEGAGSAGIDQVQVLNLQGKILLTQREKSSQNVQLDVSSLAAGVYVVKIYSGEKTAFKKIVIAK